MLHDFYRQHRKPDGGTNLMNEESDHRYQERLAILLQGDGAPDAAQQAIARADVERFEREMAIQRLEEME